MNLGELIDRLGPPPADVVAVWRKQFESGKAESPPSDVQWLHDIDPRRWVVTADGRLQPVDHRDFGLSKSPLGSPRLSDESADAAPVLQPPRSSAGPRQRRRGLRIGFALALLGVAGWIVVLTYRSRDSATEGRGANPADAELKVERERLAQGRVNDASGPADRPNLDGPRDITTAEFEVAVDTSDDPQMLEEIPPLPDDTLEWELGPPDAHSDSSELWAGSAKELAEPTQASDAAVGGDASAWVELPAVGATDAARILSPKSPTTLRLEFPHEISLELATERREDARWTIRESGDGTDVARLRATARGLSFRWTRDAASVSAASQLVHGRLVAGPDNTIYLRGRIEVEPVSVAFAGFESSIGWDLSHPLPPRSATINLAFELPKEIEVGWIEPIRDVAPRRARGLAVLTDGNGESAAIAIRLDVRCSRKLSIRIRHAGRLKPNLPWRPFSAATLDKTSRQAARRVLELQTRLAAIHAAYEIADSAGRDRLQPQRDATESAIESTQRQTEALAKFQTLVRRVREQVRLRVKLSASWPEGPQPVLRTAATAEQ